jgi:hypothetical protein
MRFRYLIWGALKMPASPAFQPQPHLDVNKAKSELATNVSTADAELAVVQLHHG